MKTLEVKFDAKACLNITLKEKWKIRMSNPLKIPDQAVKLKISR